MQGCLRIDTGGGGVELAADSNGSSSQPAGARVKQQQPGQTMAADRSNLQQPCFSWAGAVMTSSGCRQKPPAVAFLE
jgi:hypothetical protein